MRRDVNEFLYHNGLIKSERYDREKKLTGMKRNVREGDYVWILRESYLNPGKQVETRAKVEAMTKFFVCLKFQAGYKESLHWDDFQKSLI